jgi:hypothetical protein
MFSSEICHENTEKLESIFIIDALEELEVLVIVCESTVHHS